MSKLSKKEITVVNKALKKIDSLLTLEEGISLFEVTELEECISKKLRHKLIRALGWELVVHKDGSEEVF